ncbi:MAG: hypothetical protein F4X64_11500 [Chloroflexi bacterium]|nr:hypothetical protein [Chloroflexota bacterium]
MVIGFLKDNRVEQERQRTEEERQRTEQERQRADQLLPKPGYSRNVSAPTNCWRSSWRPAKIWTLQKLASVA